MGRVLGVIEGSAWNIHSGRGLAMGCAWRIWRSRGVI